MSRLEAPHLCITYKRNLEIPLTEDLQMHLTTPFDYNALLEPLAKHISDANHLDHEECRLYLNIIRRWKNILSSIQSNNVLLTVPRPLAYNKIKTIYRLLNRKTMTWHHPWSRLKGKLATYYGIEPKDQQAEFIFDLLFKKSNELKTAETKTILKWMFQDQKVQTLQLTDEQKDKLQTNFTELLEELKVALTHAVDFSKVKGTDRKKRWMEILNETVSAVKTKNRKAYVLDFDDNRKQEWEDAPDSDFQLNREGPLEDLHYKSQLCRILDHLDAYIDHLFSEAGKTEETFLEEGAREVDRAFYCTEALLENNQFSGVEPYEVIIMFQQRYYSDGTPLKIIEKLLTLPRFKKILKPIQMHIKVEGMEGVNCFKIALPEQDTYDTEKRLSKP